MRKNRADALVKDYGEFAPLSMHEATALANRAFADAPATREEAQVLLGACALFGASEHGWRQIVVDQVTRCLVQEGVPGRLEAGAEDWLIAVLSDCAGQSHETALELVRAIMQTADNASERLGRIGLRAALASLRAVAPRTAMSKTAMV